MISSWLDLGLDNGNVKKGNRLTTKMRGGGYITQRRHGGGFSEVFGLYGRSLILRLGL